MGSPAWPPHLPVGAVRFARPTNRLAECEAFYAGALGLPVIASFADHQGYDGVVLGLPGPALQLELVHRQQELRLPEPSPENQLVLYLDGAGAVAALVRRMESLGHRRVEPENPYWAERGAAAFPDPDGWVVLLAPWVYS
jgi:catechol 2,3-dioxygenase-like lactoylglutathione lyase family enzyme